MTVTHNGLIATEGKEAHGIIAQSIGGGGGSGGMAIAGDVQLGLAKPDSDTDPSSMRLSIGGKGVQEIKVEKLLLPIQNQELFELVVITLMVYLLNRLVVVVEMEGFQLLLN